MSTPAVKEEPVEDSAPQTGASSESVKKEVKEDKKEEKKQERKQEVKPEMSVNKEVLWRHLDKLYEVWMQQRETKVWGGKSEKKPTALLVIIGRDDENVSYYQRGGALMVYLFGLPEIAETAMILGEDKTVHMLTTGANVKTFREIGSNGKFTVKVLEAVADDKYEGSIKALHAAAGLKDGSVVGGLPKEKVRGPFGRAVLSSFKENNISIRDVAVGFSSLMMVKDEEERELMRTAAALTNLMCRKYLGPRVLSLLDPEKESKTHLQLSDEAADTVRDPDLFMKRVKKLGGTIKDQDLALLKSVNKDDLDVAYQPIIQSGGKYNLLPSAESNEDALAEDGAFIYALGLQYKQYCSHLARTYLIGPTPDQENMYRILLDVYKACRSMFREGNKLNQAWAAAEQVIKKTERPGLLEKFTKNCGAGIGLEFRDASYVVKSTNQKTFKSGMTFYLSVGFDKLTTKASDGSDRNYALMVADTLVIRDGEPEMLTHLKRELGSISFSYEESDAENDDAMADAAGAAEEEEKQLAISDSRTRRSGRTNIDMSAPKLDEEQEKAYQARMLEKIIEEGKRRAKRSDGDEKDDVVKTAKKINAYKSPDQFPAAARGRPRLFVDLQRQAVLVPIGEFLVPFHVSTIKNLTQTDEGDFNVLRINFNTPTANAKRSGALPSEAPDKAMYIQELTFKSMGNHLSEVFRSIKVLQKRIKDEDKMMEQKETLVEQKDLVLFPKTDKIARLRDVSIKPLLGRGKISGTVEVQKNGLRFRSTKNQILDVIYNNIKHAVLQPCDKKTSSVILHLELRNPILINKKQSTFVQFYYEVVEASQDLDSRVYGGEDAALREEEEEALSRQRWNKKFQDLSKLISHYSSKKEANSRPIEIDAPFTALSFMGVPGKEQTRISPTLNCLVALDDADPMCISMADVDVVSLERVQFNLRGFDLVLVFKDFNRDPKSITAIPMKDLEDVKKWLQEMGMLYYENKQNLSWKLILKTITSDIGVWNFYDEGGWAQFLADAEAASDEEDEDDEAEESEYAPSSSDEEEEDSEEYATSDDDASEEEEESDEESGEESGEDWDELEKKAREEDKKRFDKRGREIMDDDDAAPKMKKKRRKG